ncbi:MAG: hypothetical protein HUJ25_12625 [Crocinitomicaceae bacterium]|nr:hypothetical protein [Crocinitomicaceae bacterium]
MNYGKAPKTLMLILLICIVPSCKEDPPVDNTCWDGQLPCATTEGKNIFGCYIDGQPFVADVDFTVGGPIAVDGNFNEDTKWLSVQGTYEDPDDNLESIYLYAYILNGIGSYFVDITGTEQHGYIDFSGQKCNYYHDPDNPGTVNISFLDTEENIISGTFGLILKNSACTSDTLMQITDGRFDILY